MAKLPQISANELIKILLRHLDERTIIVPNHPGEKLDRGLLNKILKKDIKISREDFERIY